MLPGVVVNGEDILQFYIHDFPYQKGVKLTPDVNSGHEVFSCRYIPFIELPLVLSGR
jgi:hypothetical protein